MAKILVLGGKGFYGSRVVAALRALDGRLPEPLSVDAGGRSCEVAVDLNRTESFEAIRGYDLVVNSSDSIGAPPDAAMAWCVEREIPWFDMGADASTVQRLLGMKEVPGVGLVGVGVFPGLSTALAKSVGEGAERVELGVRLSPLSGAGRGNCALMTEMLSVPGRRYEGGQCVEYPPVSGSARIRYGEAGEAVSLGVGLPDVELIRRATGARDVATYMAMVPGFMRFNLRILSAALGAAGPLRPVLLTLTRGQLWLLRGVLLRGVNSRVQLTAVADRGTARERSRTLDFADGQLATARGVAAAAALWLAGQRPPPGVHTAACYDIDDLLRAAYSPRELEQISG